MDARLAKKLEVDAVVAAKRVPVADVKKRLGTVRPPVEEATVKLRLVVDALVAKRLVEVELVKNVEEP